VQSATKVGMEPILSNGIIGFVQEPDIVLAESAIAGNAKLIEGVVATYPDERSFLEMASMARANYAFGFVHDELEAVRVAYPGDEAKSRPLLDRLLRNYAAGRAFAERALALADDWADIIGGRPLEEISKEELASALAELEEEDAPSLFWLAFNWGGAMQAELDPAKATQLPKVEMIANRVIELDDTVFFGVGPHLMAAVFFGFRAPAIGGNPEAARKHFALAREKSGLLLPLVLEAQYVDAQTENLEHFQKTLSQVIEAKPREDRAVFETLAKIKACRLLANVDQLFLADPGPIPPACLDLPHKHPLREAK
jgi:hypothetical protein